MDFFDWANDEIGQKMGSGEVLFLALYVCMYDSVKATVTRKM